jgi:hypothetical protein
MKTTMKTTLSERIASLAMNIDPFSGETKADVLRDTENLLQQDSSALIAWLTERAEDTDYMSDVESIAREVMG